MVRIQQRESKGSVGYVMLQFFLSEGTAQWGQCDCLFIFRLWFFTGSWLTVHGIPVPAFLKFDLCYVRVLCTFSNIFSSWDCQKLVVEQLLRRAGGTVSHGRRYKPPGTVQITPPPPILQLRRAGRCVGSTLYGLQPLCSSFSLGRQDSILRYLPYFS